MGGNRDKRRRERGGKTGQRDVTGAGEKIKRDEVRGKRERRREKN